MKTMNIKLSSACFDFNKPTLGFINHVAEQVFEPKAREIFQELRAWVKEKAYHPRVKVSYLFNVASNGNIAERATINYSDFECDAEVLSLRMFASASHEAGENLINLVGRKVTSEEALKSLEEKIALFNEQTNKTYLGIVSPLRPMFRKIFDNVDSVYIFDPVKDGIWNMVIEGENQYIIQLVLHSATTEKEA